MARWDTGSDSIFNRLVAGEVRAERDRRRLTIEELVRAAGMNRSTLLRYLYAERSMPLPALYRISGALGIEPYELVARASAQLSARRESERTSA